MHRARLELSPAKSDLNRAQVEARARIARNCDCRGIENAAPGPRRHIALRRTRAAHQTSIDPCHRQQRVERRESLKVQDNSTRIRAGHNRIALKVKP